jgi:hypothetical protein
MAEQGKATQHKRNIELRLVTNQATEEGRRSMEMLGLVLVLAGLSIFWFGIGLLLGWAFL